MYEFSANTAAFINEFAFGFKYDDNDAYKVSQPLSTEKYKEVQSELILHNCLLGRGDFISNPRASSCEPLPPITIRTPEDLQTVQDRLGIECTSKAYKVFQSLSTDEYKEVQSELILHNCLVERGDFISNPSASSREPLPPITIRTPEDLQTVQDSLGKTFRVVVAPDVPRVLRERTIE
ncbi:hypothetical protein OIU78_026184 [Salix suchowensis]|nr:hypothetical protein OIU78_026184 [Salix suchowensis]